MDLFGTCFSETEIYGLWGQKTGTSFVMRMFCAYLCFSFGSNRGRTRFILGQLVPPQTILGALYAQVSFQEIPKLRKLTFRLFPVTARGIAAK
jgi:hypothetical protein